MNDGISGNSPRRIGRRKIRPPTGPTPEDGSRPLFFFWREPVHQLQGTGTDVPEAIPPRRMRNIYSHSAQTRRRNHDQIRHGRRRSAPGNGHSLAGGLRSSGPGSPTRQPDWWKPPSVPTNKAESLNRSFTDVIPPAPVRETYRPPSPAPGTQATEAAGTSSTDSGPQDPKPGGPCTNTHAGPLRASQRARGAGRNGVPQPAPDRDGTHADRIHPSCGAAAAGLDATLQAGQR